MTLRSPLAPLLLLTIAGTAPAQLVGHWVADDWSGTGPWVDRVSQVPAAEFGDPTISNNLFITPGSLRGLSFDGNDAFNVAAANSPVTGATDMTVMAMFRTSRGGRVNNVGANWWNNSGIVGGEAIGNHNDWGLMLLQDGRPQGGTRQVSVERGNVLDGRIHTAAITWDGAAGKLDFYLDGMLQGSVTSTPGPIANFGFAIGQFQEDGFVVTNRANFFTGDIAVVQMYRSIENVEQLHSALIGCVASAPNYGTGVAGNLGIPSLTTTAAPAFNTTVDVVATNSAGAATSGLLLVGQQRAFVPILGGTLLVNPIAQAFWAVPSAGRSISVAVPDLSGLCTGAPAGLEFYIQLLLLDNAAPAGVAMTPGLRFLIGR